MDAINVLGALNRGEQAGRQRALDTRKFELDEIRAKKAIETQDLQNKKLDFELNSAKEQDKMEGSFMPLSKMMPGYKENPELVGLWKNKALQGGFKDHIKEEGDEIFVTGKAMKYVMGLYKEGSKTREEMATSSMKARQSDNQAMLNKIGKQLAEGVDESGKKLKPGTPEHQELQQKRAGYLQLSADLLTAEKQMREEKVEKGKQVGVTGSRSPVGGGKWIIEKEDGSHEVEGKPYNPSARYGDQNQSEITAATGRSTTTFQMPKPPSDDISDTYKLRLKEYGQKQMESWGWPDLKSFEKDKANLKESGKEKALSPKELADKLRKETK
jgi:hypothetical protein